MNILLVDDDRYVIAGLQQGIDWARLQIDGVYTAFNIREAKRIFEQKPIDLLLCDIEMPGGSGLELLKWLRGSGRQTVNVFLTNYAQFDYAQQALELGSFDYYLKPISYEKLTQILSRACARVREERERAEALRLGQRWVQEGQSRKNAFFQALLTGDAAKDGVERALRERRVELPAAGRYRALLLELGLKPGERWEGDLLAYALWNMAGELFCDSGGRPAAQGIFSDTENRWFLVLAGCGETASLRAAGERFVAECNRYLASETRCFISECAALAELPDAARALLRLSRDSVCRTDGVFSAADAPVASAGYRPPELAQWELLLSAGRERELLEQADRYLDGAAARGALGFETLGRYYTDLLQMIFSVLQKKRVPAHKLFPEDESGLLYQQAVRSLRAMKETTHALIHRASESFRGAEESKSAADRICDYIDAHLDEEITRETIGELMFLHPGYVARLFKKEKGVSIGAYLTRRRVERAQYLLRHTELPVNTVAQQVGYYNFSYFTKVFKEHAGVTPVEYRRGRP